MTAMMLETVPEIADETLVARARAGDRTAFGKLVERHYDFIHAIAFRWTGSKADAEDVAQDVCIRLGHTIRDYRGSSALRTWLYAVTLNAVRDLKRKAFREDLKAAAFRAQALVEIVAEPEEDEAELLWVAVRALPPKQRDAILLVYGEGLSHADASEVLACAEATVSWHIHEAKKRLRHMLSAGAE